MVLQVLLGLKVTMVLPAQPEPRVPLVLPELALSLIHISCIQLCVCYYRLGAMERALYSNEQAGTYKPDSQAYLDKQRFFAKSALAVAK